MNKLLFYKGKNRLNILNSDLNNGTIKFRHMNKKIIISYNIKENNIFEINNKLITDKETKLENLLFNVYDNEGYSLMFGLCDVYNY